MKSIKEMVNKEKPISSNTRNRIYLKTRGNNRRFEVQFNKDASVYLNINFINMNITHSIENIAAMHLNYIYYKIYQNDQSFAKYLLKNLHIDNTRSRSFRMAKYDTNQNKKYTIAYLKSSSDYIDRTTIKARVKNN